MAIMRLQQFVLNGSPSGDFACANCFRSFSSHDYSSVLSCPLCGDTAQVFDGGVFAEHLLALPPAGDDYTFFGYLRPGYLKDVERVFLLGVLGGDQYKFIDPLSLVYEVGIGSLRYTPRAWPANWLNAEQRKYLEKNPEWGKPVGRLL